MEARPGKQERGQRIGKTRAVRLCLQMGKTAHNPGVVGRRPFLGCHRHTTANCLAPTSKSDHLTLSLSSRENVLVSALRGGTRDVATPARSRWSITNSASTTALTYWYGAQSADDAIAQPSAGRSNRRARRQRRPRRTRRQRGHAARGRRARIRGSCTWARGNRNPQNQHPPLRSAAIPVAAMEPNSGPQAPALQVVVACSGRRAGGLHRPSSSREVPMSQAIARYIVGQEAGVLPQ